jgi:8-oxo-dGTP pyrophosphatase MutT (NUDIX family)
MNDANDDADPIWCPHVTVASVVADENGRYLMVEETVGGAICYNQPAGHLEPGESLLEAAMRETLEETGWHIELTHLIGVHQWYSPHHGDHIVRFSFSGRPLAHAPEQTLDEGILGPLWLEYGDIVALGDRLRSPLVLRSIDAWLRGQRLPLTAIDCLLEGTETRA